MKKEDNPVPRAGARFLPELASQAALVRMVLDNLQAVGGRKVSCTDLKVHQVSSSMTSPAAMEATATVNIYAGKGWSPWYAQISCVNSRVWITFMGRPISEQKMAEIIAIMVRKD